MTMNGSGNSSMHSEINVTPMIDVLLVLLVIFMVIVPLAPRGELAALPQPAKHDLPSPPDNPVVLEIVKGSQGNTAFRINQQPVSISSLRARLADIFANRAQHVLFIKADDQLSFHEVAEAIDISHAAGIDRVGLITPRVAEGL